MHKKYGSMIYSSVITLSLFLILYALASFYPFGDGLISWCDMNQQTIPLINTFKDILSNGEGLFQNFHHAGGMDFYGVFFFFVASPFNFLTLLVDKADMGQFMNVLVALKLSVAAASASFFFSKRNQNLSVAVKTALGVSYAFCGYGMLFFQNIIWLDIMALFPLILLSCYALLEKGKMLPLILSLSACIVINYYISFMVILFIILFFALKTAFGKGCKDLHIKLGISAFSALLLSGVVWVPCLLQYFSSARGSGLIEGLQNAAFFTSYETAIPVVLCSALTFSVVTFAASSGYFKAKKESVILIFLMLIPLLIEPVNMMWHTGNYMSFPARFAFITSFLLCELTADIIEDTQSTEKSRISFLIPSVVFSALCGGFLVWYTQKNFETLSIYTSTLWGNRASFEGIFGAFTVAALLYCALFAFLKYKKISKRIFTLCISLILVAECVCSAGIYMLSVGDKFNNENYQKILTASEKIDDDSFYFVKQKRKYTDANQLGGFSVNTLGHYTSLNSATFMEGAKMLGYSGYWMEINSSGGSVLSDALLNVKYTMNQSDGDYYFSQNKVFPNLIFSDTPFEQNLSGNRLTALDKALNGATKTTAVTQHMSGTGAEHRLGNELYEGEILHYTISATTAISLYFDCYNGFSNKLTEPINGAATIYVDGHCMMSDYPTQSNNGLLHLGEYENTVVTVDVKINKNICASSFGVFSVDMQKFDAVCENIKGISLNADGGALYGEITESLGRYAFIPVPYKEGISIKIGGKSVEYAPALIGFICVDTQNYTGKIEIEYTPKGFYAGVILSLLGILAAVLILRLKKEYPPVLVKLSTVMFNLLSAAFLLCIYILPIIINMSA